MKPACGLLFALLWPLAQAGEVIHLKGSDTFGAKLAPQWADAYQAGHPGVKLEITAEGSPSAFAALLDGSADIGMSTRGLNPEEQKKLDEKGIGLERNTAAYDGWAIMVNTVNPVTNLTRKQVEGLFTGDITNWKDAGGADEPVRIFTRNPASGRYRDFQVLAMSGRAYTDNARFIMGGDSTPIDVANTPGGIAAVGITSAHRGRNKLLRIEGREPVEANLTTYPYLRSCSLFIRRDAPEEVRKFVQWACSAKGREISRKAGFLTD